MSWLLLLGAAYLLGSISFSVLIVRAIEGFDVREHGSGNAGATNVLRLAGKGPAVAVLIADIAKGVLPVQVAQALGAPGAVVGASAVAAVAGHVFPAFHGLRGGKGVATATGALGSLAPLAALPAILLFAAVALATRFIALASIAAVSAFPLLMVLAGQLGWTPPPPAWLLASTVGIALLIIVKHRDNFERLRAGTEHRLGDSARQEDT
ncbi:MAG: glycerol-3-phosphate 1-O-acyltransferase PlsY [Acidobacteriota bacterium]